MLLPVSSDEAVRVEADSEFTATLDGRTVYLNLLLNEPTMENGRYVGRLRVRPGAREQLDQVEGPIAVRADTAHVLADPHLRQRLRELAERYEIGIDMAAASPSDEGLPYLADMPGLTVLNLTGGEITDAGVQSLTGLRRLRVLQISRTRVTREGLRVLAGLHQLEMLDRGGNAGITDAGLRHLAGLRRLRTLALHETGISAAGLHYLSELPLLVWLSVYGTSITEADVLPFRRSHPDVEVLW